MNDIKIKAFLVISSSGSLRVVKTRPALSNNEIALTLNLEIPNVFFERLMPTANIVVPKEAITSIDPEVAVTIAAQNVSDALKLDFTEVHEGLRKLILKKENDEVEE